jgi:uncharacterized protein (DUF1499 family)
MLARIRPRDANPAIYAGLSAAEQQHAAYPDLEPLEQDASAQSAYQAALAVVTKRRWRIVDQRPPLASRREGRIEAVARTPIMGFREDVVVRIRDTGDGSRIDVRSSSRYGTFDFGSNAVRVRRLIDEIDDVIGDLKPDQPVVVPPPKKGKAQQQPKPSQRSERRRDRR